MNILKFQGTMGAMTLLSVLSACGGGEMPENSDLNATQNQTQNQDQTQNQSQVDNGPWQRSVLSSLMFQSTGIEVKPGQRITIRSTGTVTVGLMNVQNAGLPNQVVSQLYADANGANGWGYNSQTRQFTPPNPSGLMNFNCGLQAGVTQVRNMRNDGVIETIPSPIESFGPCCSNTKRAVLSTAIFVASTDLVNGVARHFVDQNQCSAEAPHGALVMKIVPKGQAENASPVIRVQKLYETNPYTVQTEGVIHLGVNDLFYRADNDGAFNVTIQRLP